MTQGKTGGGPQKPDGDPFAPAKVAKLKGGKPKNETAKGQNISQNTHNQGYQQDR